MGLEIGDLGFGIRDWDWVLGMSIGIGIGQLDRGLGLGIGIEIGNRDWGLRIWKLELRLRLGIEN